jgi:hypothetical protein
MGKTISVGGYPCLISYRCPSEVGFEFRSLPKVQDIANCRDDGSRLDRPDSHRLEDFPFTRLLNELSNLCIELLDMFLARLCTFLGKHRA